MLNFKQKMYANICPCLRGLSRNTEVRSELLRVGVKGRLWQLEVKGVERYVLGEILQWMRLGRCLVGKWQL